jgi:hypothetical protein
LGQSYLENQRRATGISSTLRSQEWRYFFSNCTRLRSFGVGKEGEEAHPQREAFPLFSGLQHRRMRVRRTVK